MEDKKVLLSIKNLDVKFRVRGRILTAIRNISLDIYEHETIAIVGESGSGKSVFTKTFAGMLESNGFISNGEIIFADDELSDTKVPYDSKIKDELAEIKKTLNEYAKLRLGAETYKKILELESEKRQRESITDEEEQRFTEEYKDLNAQKVDLFNLKQTLDPSKEKDKIKECASKIKEFEARMEEVEKKKAKLIKDRKAAAASDTTYNTEYARRMNELKTQYQNEIQGSITPEMVAENDILAKEVILTAGRYDGARKNKIRRNLLKALKDAMMIGVDLKDDEAMNQVFGKVTFRVRFLDETAEYLHGYCILDVSKVKDPRDWGMIRGTKIATVFQDPMTSLNPIITIGKQISSIIIKHQHCSEAEARKRALELMAKVGIPKPEARYDDYPFQYSGGMRQRIVIAIALSCQPKILICDEPTTALDVTIQAQILQLIKDLQKDFGFTTVFITHDLGVVANVADRVAVLYAGQVIELGTVDEVFYDPRHPYTWALLSSLPQLAQKNTKLYSITGTPPSLYNSIVGDAFAPRNPYCLKIDTLLEPPMFQVSETHFAKTWLLDEKAPKVDKPEAIHDTHEKLIKAFNI